MRAQKMTEKNYEILGLETELPILVSCNCQNCPISTLQDILLLNSFEFCLKNRFLLQFI